VPPGGVPTPAAVREAVRAHGVTTLLMTTAFFNATVDEAPDALKGVRQVIVGGEAMSPAHVARAAALMPEARFVNGYGPTESTTFAACHVLTFPLERDTTSVPIGRPIAGTETYVLDAHGQPVPVGVPGELHIGGAEHASVRARGRRHRRQRRPAQRRPPRRLRRAGARRGANGRRAARLRQAPSALGLRAVGLRAAGGAAARADGQARPPRAARA